MTKTELNTFRKTLEKRRAGLESGSSNRQALSIETSPDELDRIQGATEREIAIGNLERDYKLLCDVRAALGRIAANTFGICLDCEEEISLKRLMAVPWTPSCIGCQEAEDNRQKLPRGGMDASLVKAA